MREHHYEPVPGLPERLPEGETLLWQGAPRWVPLAVQAFHVRKVAFYFALLVIWRIAAGVADRDPALKVAADCGWLAVAALVACGVLLALAWFTARATLYTITDQRIVMRFGIALSMALNLPFRRVESAQLKLHRDGTGDIALQLNPGDHVAYLHLWPHARRWRFSHPQPALRALADPQRVSLVLARAVATTGAAAMGSSQADMPANREPRALVPATN